MKRRRQHPEPVADVTQRILRAAGGASPAEPGEPAEPDAPLVRAFALAAGPAISRHARPRALRDGVLVLAVDHGVWLQEISFFRAELARKVGAALGQPVRELKLVLDRVDSPGTRAGAAPVPTASREPPPPSPADQALAAQATEPLRATDPELGEAAARALGRWRAKRRREEGE